MKSEIMSDEESEYMAGASQVYTHIVRDVAHHKISNLLQGCMNQEGELILSDS